MSRKRSRPTAAEVEARRWADELAARKRAERAAIEAEVAAQHERRRLTPEQRRAMRPSAAELRVIRAGQRMARTWDEVNSTMGGGRDFRRPS